MVIADYTATESGMLSVNVGEKVDLLETSSNEWCLVRPREHPSQEGWVPMAYVCPCDAEGFINHSPRTHSLSTSSDEGSETPTELSEQSFFTSPEPLGTCDDEEQRANAEEMRRWELCL